MHIIEGGLDDARVVALLHTHLSRARAETAPGSAHALDLSGLRAADVTFWSAWEGDVGSPAATVVGVGALRALSPTHGEVKSMHTAEACRGRGIGGTLLRHIEAVARARGMTRLSLETGAWPYFAPARALYARHGFVACPPFGDYRPDPNSVFMTRALDDGATLATGRRLPHAPAAVFAAFADPEVLGRWWGPHGFTTRFSRFAFAPGARWEYVMEGPNGAQYPNEAEVRVLEAPARLVLAHVSPPRFVLTVACREDAGATELTWVQVFDDPAVAARVRHVAEPANEENLDRLAAVLAMRDA